MPREAPARASVKFRPRHITIRNIGPCRRSTLKLSDTQRVFSNGSTCGLHRHSLGNFRCLANATRKFADKHKFALLRRCTPPVQPFEKSRWVSLSLSELRRHGPLFIYYLFRLVQVKYLLKYVPNMRLTSYLAHIWHIFEQIFNLNEPFGFIIIIIIWATWLPGPLPPRISVYCLCVPPRPIASRSDQSRLYTI